MDGGGNLRQKCGKSGVDVEFAQGSIQFRESDVVVVGERDVQAVGEGNGLRQERLFFLGE